MEAIPDEPTIAISRRPPDAYGAMANGVNPTSTSSTSSTPFNPNTSMNSSNADSLSVGGADKAPLLRVNSRFLRGLSPFSAAGIMDGRRDGLTTFAGVFAPVTLSMFSVLLFLRGGYVVSQAGILLTLGMLILAYFIIFLTVLALSAVSTNGAIEGGGVYYMISRALGPEFGGAIGTLFFLANVFSCGLYIVGLREAVLNNFGPGGTYADVLPSDSWFPFLYDFCISLLALAVCLVGSAMFGRTSIVVLIVIVISYLSSIISLMVNHSEMPIMISKDNRVVYPVNESTGEVLNDTQQYRDYTGLRSATFRENLMANFTQDYTTMQTSTFASVFAVVFSGVTGIMAGANMSGDLKRPDISIPKGTMLASFFTFVVYVLLTLQLGGSCARDLLRNNYIVMQPINFWPPFILIGILCATFFAALSNLIGASRVLVRLAEDKLFGFLLKPMTTTMCNGNPVVAVAGSWGLVVCVLIMGSLNKIAKIASIFFLLSYMGVNLACLALELSSAPNFRPKFHYFSWHTALLGFILSVVMMFVIEPVFTGIAIIFLLLLLMVLHYIAPMAQWGSISQALIFHQVRKYLLLLDPRKDHVKYWRPQVLLLVANPKSSLPLIDFVNDLKKSGLYVLGHVKKGKFHEFEMDPLLEDYPYWLGLVDYLKVKTFVELTLAHTIRDGVHHLVRLSGLGAMKPNTIVLGFYDSAKQKDTFQGGSYWAKANTAALRYAKLERVEIEDKFSVLREEDVQERNMSPEEYVNIVSDILRMHKNVVLARNFSSFNKEAVMKCRIPAYIDVWPVDMSKPSSINWGFDNSCLFLLQMACILNMVSGWRRHTIVRVFLCVTSQQDIKHRENQIRNMLEQLRITAQTQMVPWDHVICHLTGPRPGDGESTSNELDFSAVPERYVASMNETIRRHTDASRTAVVFVNLPLPPGHEGAYGQYLKYLDLLSSSLPPTLLVHGVSSVISTAL